MGDWVSAITLSSTADILSIIAFFFTLYAILKIRGINGRLVMRNRQKKWLTSVRERATDISRTLGTVGAASPQLGGRDPDAIVALAKTRPLVRAIRKALPPASAEWREMMKVEARLSRYLESGVLRLVALGDPIDSLPRLIYAQLLELAEFLQETVSQSNIYREGA
jgi:hypothetical protein